MIEVVD